MNNLNKYNDFLSKNKINESLEVHDETELKSIFNLVLENAEIYKLPYGHYSSIDFNIYIIHGDKNESDHNFLQEMYNYHGILNHIYNLNFFHITMTDKVATIVLYDFIMDPSYNKNYENYLSSINKFKLQKAVPDNVYRNLIFNKDGVDTSYRNSLTKGIDYSNGDGSNLSLFDWKYSNNNTNEDINVPIKIGDTILGGRFKNKKIVVKKIGKNKKGDITINDKPLLKYRIIKESININQIEEYCNVNLITLTDENFDVTYHFTKKDNKTYYNITIEIDKTFDTNILDEIYQWDDIKDCIIPFFEFIDNDITNINVIFSETKDVSNLDRMVYNKTDIINDTISVKNFIVFRFAIEL